MGPKTLWIVSPFTFIYEFFQSNEIYPENIGYIIYFDCGIPKMVDSKKQGFWTNILWKQWNAAHHKSQNHTFKVDFILEHFIFKTFAQILMIWNSSVSQNKWFTVKLSIICTKILLFKTHHLWNSKTELIVTYKVHNLSQNCVVKEITWAIYSD